MKQLTLKELSAYLPHGLSFKCSEITSGEYEVNYISEIDLANETVTIGTTDYDFSDLGKRFNGIEVKPCLRPLSDLTKEIIHNGKSFVPIVQLAEIMYENHTWKLNKEYGFAISERGYSFEYDEGYDCFLFENSAQMNQLELSNKLLEWHFDVNNLIDKGLAIKINTLEE